jgi:hypothetical protein
VLYNSSLVVVGGNSLLDLPGGIETDQVMPEPVEHIEEIEQTQPSDQGQPVQSTAPAPRRKGIHLTRKQRTWLAIIVIAIMVVCAFYAPPEGDSDNVMGDPASIPPVVATNLIASTPLNQHLTYRGLQYTFVDAKLAQKFSDDRKPLSKYTLRVDVFVKNVSQNVVGVNYATQVHLLDGHGQVVANTEFISIKPAAEPGSTQTGSFDFPLAQPVPLSSFSLQLANGVVIPLK